MTRASRGVGPRQRRRPQIDTLDVGQKVRDARERKLGVVLDLAKQYSHPNAHPVHNYLVRWEDGQVEAISENALGAAPGIEPID